MEEQKQAPHFHLQPSFSDEDRCIGIALMLFFTTWTCIFVMLGHWLHPHIDLLFLTIFTCVVGTGIFFIHPRHVSLKLVGPYCNGNVRYTLTLQGRIWANTIVHVIPLIIVLVLYKDYYHKIGKWGTPTLVACMLIFSYLILMNIERVYGGDMRWFVVYAIAAIGIYAYV